MPGRQHPLLINEVYHVYNRSLDGRHIFSNKNLIDLFIRLLWYYRSTESRIRYSTFRKLENQRKLDWEIQINNRTFFRVYIEAFCLMQTHYHLLIRQITEGGIAMFISQIQNSFTRYYNIKSKRSGPIFVQRFRSKPIISEEMYKHVSRYIHLNPYSSGAIRSKDELAALPHSSLGEYANNRLPWITEGSRLLSMFSDDRNKYIQFVLENAEYQKMLEYCKYSNRW